MDENTHKLVAAIQETAAELRDLADVWSYMDSDAEVGGAMAALADRIDAALAEATEEQP